jgi:hypothetical protein
MPNIIRIAPPVLTQIKDRQSWVTGTNAIVFDRPYRDLEYTFECQASGKVLHEVLGTRTVLGLSITADADTSEGYYEANGLTDDFTSVFVFGSGTGGGGTGGGTGSTFIIYRISQVLVEGDNTITLPGVGFTTTNYTILPEFANINVYVVDGSKTVSTFVVNAAMDDTVFNCIVIGV